jgi:hypothetical protein
MASVEIVLADAQPPRRHGLAELAAMAGLSLEAELLELQTFALEAVMKKGPFHFQRRASNSCVRSKRSCVPARPRSRRAV